MVMRDLIVPPESLDFATMVDQLAGDIQTLKAIRETRYLCPRDHVPKAGNLYLACLGACRGRVGVQNFRGTQPGKWGM
jgi:hypothetical protein